MAAIEKVCEYSGEYPSWKMYGYKRNHIQIMPKFRKEFRGLKATLEIKKNGELYQLGDGWTTQYYPDQNVFEDDERTRGDIEKIRGKWHQWVCCKNKRNWIYAKPIRILPEYYYVLTVPDCKGNNTVYKEWSFQPTQVIRRMKRLVGARNLTVVRS